MNTNDVHDSVTFPSFCSISWGCFGCFYNIFNFFRNVHSETRPVPAGFCFRRIERIFEYRLRRRRRIRPCRCQERVESSHWGDEHLVGREHRLDPRKHKNRERNGQTGFGELVYRFILKIPNSKQLFGTEFIKIGFS